MSATEFKAAMEPLRHPDWLGRLVEVAEATSYRFSVYEDVLDERSLRGIDVSEAITAYWKHYQLAHRSDDRHDRARADDR